MSLFPISSARGLIGQPVMAYGWEIAIPNLPAELASYAESFSVKARSVSIPGVSGAAYDTQFGPFVFNHPGKKTYPRQLTIRFEESYNSPIVEALKLWKELLFNEETGVGVSEESQKVDLWIRLLGPAFENEDSLANAIHVYEAFPVSIQDSPLDYSVEGQVFIEVTMGYNIWRWEPLSV